MQKRAFGLVGRICLCAMLVVLVSTNGLRIAFPHLDRALAQTPEGTEKAAFDAAKELGTVEAWDAFLAHHSKGLYADLARAYLKKMVSDPAAGAPAPAVAALATYPMPAGSWGGVVRNGPGPNYRKVGSLQEGDPVTLIENTNVVENGYSWFKISYSGGGSGYQWGGILCSIGDERPELFKTCTTSAQREEARASAPRKCRENGGEWGDGQCWPKGHFNQKAQEKKGCRAGTYFDKGKGRCMSLESQEDGPGELNGKVNRTGLSCKELKSRCSKTDSNYDCDRYLNSCTGHGDN